jgi:hypothetical protein
MASVKAARGARWQMLPATPVTGAQQALSSSRLRCLARPALRDPLAVSRTRLQPV